MKPNFVHKQTDGLGREPVMNHETYVPYLTLNSFEDAIYLQYVHFLRFSCNKWRIHESFQASATK